MLSAAADFDLHSPTHTCANAAKATEPRPTPPSIEQVPLHRFMRGLKQNAYLNSFVMVGRDILKEADTAKLTALQQQSSCDATAPDFDNLDDSDVDLRTLEQCKLVGGVSHVAHALHVTSALRAPTANLYCPHCNFPHLDTPATCHTHN